MITYRLQPGADVPVPESTPVPEPGPGQVVVRVRLAALNNSDLGVVKRLQSGEVVPGRIPVSDGLGEVVAVGAGVTEVQVGARVVGSFHQTWISGPMLPEHLAGALGGPRDGVLAEYVVLESQGVVEVPQGMNDDTAVSYPTAGVTAFCATRAVRPGDTVLVQGTGGVSLFALGMALARGGRVLALTSSAEKHQLLRDAGAAETFDRADDRWPEHVREVTDGAGVDLVVSIAAGDTLTRSMMATRLGGRIDVIGTLGLPAAEASLVIRRALTLRGRMVGSVTDLAESLRFGREHEIRPHIGMRVPHHEIARAYKALRAKTYVGKILVNFD